MHLVSDAPQWPEDELGPKPGSSSIPTGVQHEAVLELSSDRRLSSLWGCLPGIGKQIHTLLNIKKKSQI